MSSAFSSLKSDWRPIRLADGRVIYSEGLGSIRFLSDCGYVITIERFGYMIDMLMWVMNGENV